VDEILPGKVTVFLAASTAEVSSQVSMKEALQVEAIEPSMKRGVGVYLRLSNRRQKLSAFGCAHGGYYGPAIQQYLEQPTSHPFLKYVVFLNPDGTMLGMASVPELAQLLRTDIDPEEFAYWLNDERPSELQRLPFFVSAQDSVTPTARRDRVLEKLEQLELDVLPVVDDRERFVGVVERSRITAAILIELAQKLE
jgi:hypothetical protein